MMTYHLKLKSNLLRILQFYRLLVVGIFCFNTALILGVPEYIIFIFSKILKYMTGFNINRIKWVLKIRKSYVRLFCRLNCVIMGLNRQVTYQENYEENEPKIVMSTHSSTMEILSNMHKFPFHLSFVSKKDNFKIPFIGMFMEISDHIPIHREDLKYSID